MSCPALVIYASEVEYREHYERVYCQAPIVCFDGICVRFRKEKFAHAFFESVHGGTDNLFSSKRAQRIDWIKCALEDPNSERFIGWDKYTKTYNRKRRVTVVMGNYVVVIALTKSNNADFVTAYLADTPARNGRPSTIDKIKSSPKWA